MSLLIPVLLGLGAGIALIVLFSSMMPTFSRLPMMNMQCDQHFNHINTGSALLIVNKAGNPTSKPALMPSVSLEYIDKKYPVLVDAMNKADLCYTKAVELNKGGSGLARGPVMLSYIISLRQELVMNMVNDPKLHFQIDTYYNKFQGQDVKVYVAQFYVDRVHLHDWRNYSYLESCILTFMSRQLPAFKMSLQVTRTSYIDA
jgi:hypothetical protein